MRFILGIGRRENSNLEFCRNFFTGAMRVRVDGEVVAHRSPFRPSTHFNLGTKRLYEFSTKKPEPHAVALEHERPRYLAAFRPHTYRVIVDGHVRLEQVGY